MTDPVVDAVANLKAAKNDLLAQIRRIDDALFALGALTATDADTTTPKGGTLTLKAKVLAVMEEQDKVWSAETMLDTLTADRFPRLNANDPKSGIRTVFRRLHHDGLVTDEGYGKWKATKWRPDNLLVLTASEHRAIIGDELYDAHYGEHYEPSAEDLLEMEYEARAAGYDPAKEPF